MEVFESSVAADHIDQTCPRLVLPQVVLPAGKFVVPQANLSSLTPPSWTAAGDGGSVF